MAEAISDLGALVEESGCVVAVHRVDDPVDLEPPWCVSARAIVPTASNPANG